MVRAFEDISTMDCRNFHHLNEALLTLLPKVDNPVALNGYRHISLIHNFGKIFSFMANHFAPHLPHLVSANQSAFIEGRQIHETFMTANNPVSPMKRSMRKTQLTESKALARSILKRTLGVFLIES
jgi:hypothetical protein